MPSKLILTLTLTATHAARVPAALQDAYLRHQRRPASLAIPQRRAAQPGPQPAAADGGGGRRVRAIATDHAAALCWRPCLHQAYTMLPADRGQAALWLHPIYLCFYLCTYLVYSTMYSILFCLLSKGKCPRCPLARPPPVRSALVARSVRVLTSARSRRDAGHGDMEAWATYPMEWLRAHGGSARGVRVATESTLHGGGLVATEDLEAGEHRCRPAHISLAAPVACTAVSATHLAVAVPATLAATALARCARPHRAARVHAHG